MKTIAEQIKWDFETNGGLEILDKNGKEIYSENSGGYWSKWKHDSKGNEIYNESSDGGWTKFEYDSKGNRIYFEDSNGNKAKWKYNSKGKEIYYEDSNGVIKDNRPLPCKVGEIIIEGVKYKLVKA